jgi:glutathione S-transferase
MSIDTESRAIMRYIVDKYEGQGTPKLHGSTIAERAQVEQWMEVENGTFSPIVRLLFRNLMLMPGAFNTPPDQAVVEECTAKLAKVLDIYEAHLAGSGNKYLAGDFVSIADLSHLPFAYPYFNLLQKQELLRERKHVAAWWAEISSRPAWQKVAALAMPEYTPWLKRVQSFPSTP